VATNELIDDHQWARHQERPRRSLWMELRNTDTLRWRVRNSAVWPAVPHASRWTRHR